MLMVQGSVFPTFLLIFVQQTRNTIAVKNSELDGSFMALYKVCKVIPVKNCNRASRHLVVYA